MYKIFDLLINLIYAPECKQLEVNYLEFWIFDIYIPVENFSEICYYPTRDTRELTLIRWLWSKILLTD